MHSQFIPTEEQTLTFGKKVALACQGPAIIFLKGNLGAGKTTFARGFIRGLGYEGAVKSPTYTIVEPYSFNDLFVYHFDLYRVQDAQELDFIGIQDYFASNALCLIEWPEQGASLLPPPDLSCYIEPYGAGRRINIEAHTARGRDILKRIQHD